jgi:mRNA interferase MazF
LIYEAFDVVRVPFPFADRNSAKRRPSLVLCDAELFNTAAGHSVMAMVTSASHTPWPLDLVIEDLVSAGLKSPSIVRFKIFTLDHQLILNTLGRLSRRDEQQVQRNLHRLLLGTGDPD